MALILYCASLHSLFILSFWQSWTLFDHHCHLFHFSLNLLSLSSSLSDLETSLIIYSISSSPAEKASIIILLFLWIWSFAFLVNPSFWINVWTTITSLWELYCLKAARFPWSWLSRDTFADWGITSLLQESHNNQNIEKFLRQNIQYSDTRKNTS